MLSTKITYMKKTWGVFQIKKAWAYGMWTFRFFPFCLIYPTTTLLNII